MGPAPAEKFFNFKQPPGPLAWFAGLKGSESVFFIKEFLDSVAFRDFFWFVSMAGFRAIWSASVCTSMHMCACVWAFRVCVCVCMCMCMPTGEENVVFCMGFGSSWLFVLLSIRGDCGFSYGLGFGFVFRVWQWEWWWSSSSSSSSSSPRRRLVVVASSSSPRRRRRRRRRQLFHTEMCRILLCKMQQSLLRLLRRVSPLSKNI